ncbi:MAG: caspase family protein [Candidatus Methylacidiphilales bacterium]|nr:caspase family protein [Candidatus Methylacidiphilales bacterium]
MSKASVGFAPGLLRRILFRAIISAVAVAVSLSVVQTEVAAQTPGNNEWDPKKTWIFAAGVIQFDDKDLQSWPDHNRIDDKMIQAYIRRGVPDDHIFYIKNKMATKANLEEKLAEHAKKAGKDDTFIFYYTGHGSRDYKQDSRPVNFMTYDTDSKWMVSDIVKTIQKNFTGNRVLLTADCCYSGAILEEVSRMSSRLPIAVFTSSRASSTSTGAWTFTQIITDALNGSPLLDLNGDGNITFQEMANYADEEMSFVEEQRVTYFPRPGSFFNKDLIFAKATAKKAPRVGERLEGEENGKWYKIKVLDSKDNKVFVTWLGWATTFDTWLTPEQIRPYKPVMMKNGTPIEIEWDKKWWKGSIVKNEMGLYFVHYDGYKDIDNEWVALNRVRLPKNQD